jgi:hypothetical protein
MTTRSEQRIVAEIPVRVFGIDALDKPFTKTARTIEVCKAGARLGGIDVALKINDIIGVQHGTEKARFRVAWIANPGTPQAGEVELDCLQPDKNIWGDLKPAPPKSVVAVPPELPAANGATATSGTNQERRRFDRFKCDLGASVQPDGGGNRSWARCTDISLGGCYLETWSPLPLGAQLLLMIEGIEINGSVSGCHPGVGMGVRFSKVSDSGLLQGLLTRIRQAEKPE